MVSDIKIPVRTFMITLVKGTGVAFNFNINENVAWGISFTALAYSSIIKL